MTQLNEQDLILHYYGELTEEESSEINTLLNSDAELAEQYNDLIQLLEATNQWKPENVAENFEQRIWNKLNVELDIIEGKPTLTANRDSVSVWQRLSAWLVSTVRHPAPAMALVVVLVSVAYFTGRHDQHQEMIDDPAQLVASLSSETRDKILFQSVATHLERSSRLLTTVSMDTEQSDIAENEQKWAHQLLISNRLFSKAAEQSGQWRIVSLLDELEPILIEMANSSKQTLSTRQQIKQRIDNKQLVFKTKAFKTERVQSI